MPAPLPTSPIDAVDDENTPVGQVPRREVFARGTNFRTVHVLVTDDSGNLLLQQLAASRERHPLRWGSSVAGYLYAGEDAPFAARRRMAEELGLDLPLREVGVTGMPDGGVTKFISVFTAVLEAGVEPRNAAPEQIADLRLWTPDELDVAIHSHPETFTASLLHVLDFWHGRDSDPATGSTR